MTKKRRTRITCKIDELPEEMKNNVITLVSNTQNSYMEISLFLKKNGYDISKSAVGRYALRSNSALQRLQEAQEQSKILAEAIKNNPDVDYIDASMQIMAGEFTQRMATAQEEFDELPLDKVAKLAISISRTNAYKEKLKDSMNTKAKVAFKELGDDLFRAINEDDELAPQLKELLKQAEKKMIDND